MSLRCLFNCSEHVGHLNPTLPVVKALVEAGHDVHFVCLEMARKKIEDVGATFHNTMEIQSELYAGRGLEGAALPKLAVFSIMEEHGLDMSFLNIMKCHGLDFSRSTGSSSLPGLESFVFLDVGLVLSLINLIVSWSVSYRCLNLSLELELPGTLRFLRRLKPDVLVYDPLFISRAAPLAAKVLGIPAVGLLTLAGPGSMRTHGPDLLRPLSLEEAGALVSTFAPHLEATRRINEEHGLALKPTHLVPDGYLDTCLANTVLVTTSEDLQDPATEAIAKAYEADGATFAFVGPLLLPPNPSADPVVLRVREARAAGRRVVAVSMGTVLTGGDAVAGWDADFGGQSITGRDLCRAAWAGTFDAFADSDTLMVAAVGLQPDPLGNVAVPSNALCVPTLAQVELLRAGVDVFVTHGGQNSFTEALFCATPVVVCPGFGDQVVNAAKAVTLGVGLKVDRPVIASGEEAAAAAARYRQDVSEALRRVLDRSSGPAFRAAAAAQAERLRNSGGVPRAVDLVTKAAQRHPVRVTSTAAAGA